MLRRILFLCLLLLSVATARVDGEVIEIWTVEQLSTLRDAVNAGTNYDGTTVRLMADLSLTDWTAIGATDDEVHSFKGTFDGQGHTINITANKSATVLGLFGYFRGTVQHLKVTGSITNTNTETTCSAAAIAAYNRGTISECASNAAVIGTRAGGIAGENLGIISHCYNTGYIGFPDGASLCYLGGIAGVLEAGSSTTFAFASCTIEDVSAEGGIAANKIDGAIVANSFYDVTLRNGNDETTMDGSTTLTGSVLESSFGDTYWIYSEGLPELKCLVEPIVRLGNNTDNSGTITAYHYKTCTVELSDRTLFKDNSWNTLCLPFALTEDQIAASPLAGAVIKELNSASYVSSTDVLTLNFSTVRSIEAGKPYLVKWDVGTDVVSPRFSGVTIQNIDEAGRTVQQTNVSFVGVFSPVVIGNQGDNLFLGSNNTLHAPISSDYTMNTFRAYFHLEGYVVSSSRSVVLNIDFEKDGQTTTIGRQSATASQQPSHLFTLDGMIRKGHHSKGILIEQNADGGYRKVMLKK